MLHGPGGTGKTSLVHAFANSIQANLREYSSADIVSKWVGKSGERIAEIFKSAKKEKDPLVLFFDEFEKAAEIRNKIFVLQHIRDVALISKDFNTESNVGKSKCQNVIRIEAYDISNIGGQDAVGSMVVFENEEPNKKEYRKFKIKTVVGSDDVSMMREVLLRRFQNNWPASTRGNGRSSTRGWSMPNLILLDGGQGHLNMAKKLLQQELGLNLEIVAVAKGIKRKKLDLRFGNYDLKQEIKSILENKNLIKYVMDEAHRFAIGYHRKLRKKSFILTNSKKRAIN
jgi:excinuclease UvrABC nuclease subunit